jgi:hypothetical protein
MEALSKNLGPFSQNPFRFAALFEKSLPPPYGVGFYIVATP